MSRDYGRVRTQFWSDEKVASWPLDLKCAAVYLLTSPHTTALGAFRMPVAYMAADLNLSTKDAATLMVRLQEARFIAYCDQTGWVWIKKYLAHNPPENANVRKHVAGLVKAIPKGLRFRDALVATATAALNGSILLPEPGENPIETVSKGFADGSETRAEPYRIIEPNPTEGEDTPSEAIASSGSAAAASRSDGVVPNVDLKSTTFGPCLRWLASATGKSESSLRPLMGKWCRDYRDGAVLEAIAAVSRGPPVDPIAAIVKRLESQGHARSSQGKDAQYQAGRDRLAAAARRAAGMADGVDGDRRRSGRTGVVVDGAFSVVGPESADARDPSGGY